MSTFDREFDDVQARGEAAITALKGLADALMRLADAAEVANGNLSDDDRASLRFAPQMVKNVLGYGSLADQQARLVAAWSKTSA